MLRRSIATLLFLVAVCGASAAAPAGKLLVVVGQDDINVDRPAIQAALDAVPKNGTVRLEGTFQLDGVELLVRSDHVTIEGLALDDDGDHKVNEDWADGVDNDFDGAIDEDDYNAVLNGILAGGLPDRGSYPGNALRSLYNRGIAVNDLSGVAIRDLKFTGLVRGIAFSGGSQTFYGLFCSETIATGGVGSNSIAERNLFDNDERGVQVFGDAHAIRVRDNVVVSGSFGAGILLVGDAFACWNDDDTPNPAGFPIGRPVGTQVEGNTVSVRNRVGIGVYSANDSKVRDNTLDQVTAGVDVENSPRTLVIGNHVDATWFSSIYMWDGDGLSSAGTQIQGNDLSNPGPGWSAVFMEGTVSKVKAANNTTFNAIPDYYLGPDTTKNTIVLKPGQVAGDDGTGNKINGGS